MGFDLQHVSFSYNTTVLEDRPPAKADHTPLVLSSLTVLVMLVIYITGCAPGLWWGLYVDESDFQLPQQRWWQLMTLQ